MRVKKALFLHVSGLERRLLLVVLFFLVLSLTLKMCYGDMSLYTDHKFVNLFSVLFITAIHCGLYKVTCSTGCTQIYVIFHTCIHMYI
jgi:hypothetical protein